jgi:hypothetical protein
MDIDEEYRVGQSVCCSFLNRLRSCVVLYNMIQSSNDYAWGEPLRFDLVGLGRPAADFGYFDLMNGRSELKGVWKYADL